MAHVSASGDGSARTAVIGLVLCLAVLVGSMWLASLVQRDFGRVEVTNVTYTNPNGILIRSKLLRPLEAAPERRVPGVVYIHGYQNNRETSDPYCIELARRGLAVLEMDAIGRGNSGEPGDPKAPDFDPTYGGRRSLEYLRALPFVLPDAVGMMGHSLGGEMAYGVALENSDVRALVVSGFAYTEAASAASPRNMLMIMGKWDEYRQRMTGVRDIEGEWMKTPRSRKVFPVADPRIGETYGEFAQGTARRVIVPRAIHLQVSHSQGAVAEALEWIRQALEPDPALWMDARRQIWPIKEWATLAALVAGLAFLLPLGTLLLRCPFFRGLQGAPSGAYSCTGKAYLRHAGVNALLMWLYLPLIFALFGFHIFVVRIDGAFPMMLLNALAWWFLCINVLGFLIFRRWFKREAGPAGVTLADLGISFGAERFSPGGAELSRAVLLAVILFGAAYLAEHTLEASFIVDYRFIFPFASDLTPHRAAMFFLYLPFFLVGFLQTGVFLHGQIRRRPRASVLGTFASWSLWNALALIAPLVILLLVQYVPLLTTGFIPFVGPGGMLANFTMTLFHVMGILLLTVPISTWFHLRTGTIYVGAVLNALLVTWMLVSSQVIAPVPV
jgi:hypothetical protein